MARSRRVSRRGARDRSRLTGSRPAEHGGRTNPHNPQGNLQARRDAGAGEDPRRARPTSQTHAGQPRPRRLEGPQRARRRPGRRSPTRSVSPGRASPSASTSRSRPASSATTRTELRELPSFLEATETMRRGELAGPYLEEAGITPPADAAERATLAVTYFLARMWDGASGFGLDDDRFAAAFAEIEECTEPEEGEVEAIVPAGRLPDARHAHRSQRRCDRPRRRGRRARRGGPQRASQRRRLGAHLPDQRPRRPRSRRRARRRRRAGRADLRARRHHPSSAQVRRCRPGPARLGARRRRPLAPDRNRRRAAATRAAIG